MPTTRALRGERFTDYVIWVGDPEVRQLAISVSAAPMFDALGAFDGAVLVYKDVTDLVNALRVKDDFVATVSHELRTPLTSIMGFLDLVTETDESLTDTHAGPAVDRQAQLRAAAAAGQRPPAGGPDRRGPAHALDAAPGPLGAGRAGGRATWRRRPAPARCGSRAGSTRGIELEMDEMRHAPDGRQPGQQRGEVHPARRARRGRAHRGRRPGAAPRGRHRHRHRGRRPGAPVHPLLPGPGGRDPRHPGRRARAWRSPRRSSRRTAGPSPWPPSWDAARSSRCCCPASRAGVGLGRSSPSRTPDPGRRASGRRRRPTPLHLALHQRGARPDRLPHAGRRRTRGRRTGAPAGLPSATQSTRRSPAGAASQQVLEDRAPDAPSPVLGRAPTSPPPSTPRGRRRTARPSRAPTPGAPRRGRRAAPARRTTRRAARATAPR